MRENFNLGGCRCSPRDFHFVTSKFKSATVGTEEHCGIVSAPFKLELLICCRSS